MPSVNLHSTHVLNSANSHNYSAILHSQIFVILLYIQYPPELQRLTMAGIEAHIQSPLEGVRQVGMAVGEVLMNTLCPTDDDKRLQFEYQPNSEVQALLRLSRPLDEIRRDLEVLQRKVTVEAAPCMRSEARDGGGACDGGGGGDGGGERFGEGMAKTTVCSDSDR